MSVDTGQSQVVSLFSRAELRPTCSSYLFIVLLAVAVSIPGDVAAKMPKAVSGSALPASKGLHVEHSSKTLPDVLRAKEPEADHGPRSRLPSIVAPRRKSPIPSGKILWDEKTQTFRLYSKSTLYAFRVDEGGNLEHLYWGKAIPPDDDLRFMAFTNVQLCFDPGPMSQFDDTAVVEDLLDVQDQAQGDDAMLEEWKNARKMRVLEDDPFGLDPDGLQSKDRRENAAWRLMKMRELQKQRAEGTDAEVVDEGIVMSKLQRGGSTPSLAQHGAATSGIGRRVVRSFDGEEQLQLSGKRAGSAGSLAQSQPITQDLVEESFAGSAGIVMPRRAMSKADVSPGEKKMSAGRSMGHLAALRSQKSFQDMGMMEAPAAELLAVDAGEEELFLPRVGRNTKLLEWSDMGTGDYRRPSFGAEYSDGSTISPLTYRGHAIKAGKLAMEHGRLPQLRESSKELAETLTVEMEDKLTGLTFKLVYTVFEDKDAVVRRVVVHNPRSTPGTPTKSKGAQSQSAAVRLQRLMCATIDFHAKFKANLVTLAGSWANERHVRVQPLQQGRLVSESLRGTSSHQHNPFMALTTANEEDMETGGEVFACSLVYSGNWIMEAEMSESGRTRLNAGLNPSTFTWWLPPGKSFESPECVLVYSDGGLEKMTHTFHDVFRENLISQRWLGKIPSVLINTWESMYFDVSHAKVVNLAKAAAAVGVEMVVLDDGWFGGRDDATSSLGDWHENKKKFPEGMAGLVRDVNALGLKFGIWVEPEMVNADSELYKRHPEWCLNQQGRKFRCEGRNQLVLDFTRKAVRDHICSKLHDLLSGSNIEYMKWDMNRHLTEVYGNDIAPEKQGEVFHRYMVGVYDVLHFVNEHFPHVRVETCSGGGGRFDPGMLYFGPQIWASDNTDVLSRLAIQQGTSLVYPIMSIGAHVTAVPNHQTQRVTSLKARFLVSLFGTFGLELDVRRLEKSEAIELREYIAMFKELAPTVHSGNFYRLWCPVKSSDQQAYAWMVVSKDPTTEIQAVVMVLLSRMEIGRYLPELHLRGLDEEALYLLEEIFPNTSMRDPHTGQMKAGPPLWQMGKPHVMASGAALMKVGLPIRLSHDGDACAFVLRRVPEAGAGPGDSAPSFKL